MQDQKAIKQLLGALTSPSNEERQKAEQMILSSLPQSIPVLLNISLSGSESEDVRLLSAIICKNHVISNPLSENAIMTCIQMVLSQLSTCPDRIKMMLSFFLEGLTRSNKQARLTLMKECLVLLPTSLCVYDSLLCYSYINSSTIEMLCMQNGLCDQLIQLINSQCNVNALKILNVIVSFIGIEGVTERYQHIIQQMINCIIIILKSESINGWNNALNSIRMLCGDSPELIKQNFSIIFENVITIAHKLIEFQEHNQWQNIETVTDLSVDDKESILINTVDVLSAFAALELYPKTSDNNSMNELVLLVVRLLMSPIQDWTIPKESLSHNSAENVLQMSSTTLTESGVIFLHNMILHQYVQVITLFKNKMQLLPQGSSLLHEHKRSFVNVRGTGFLILSICGNYLSKARVPIQKEVSMIINDIVRTDFALIGFGVNDELIERDLVYSLLCISSILPIASYCDLSLFLTTLSEHFMKLIQSDVIIQYILSLLVKCLSIPDYITSPYFTTFLNAILNINLPVEDMSYVLDTLHSYCKYLPPTAIGALSQSLIAYLIRCFLQNPVSPVVRSFEVQILQTLFKDRSTLPKLLEFLVPPLPTIFSFCSRQASDYPMQTLLYICEVIIKSSMIFDEKTKNIMSMTMSAARMSGNCLSACLDICTTLIKKFNNILENQEGQVIVQGMLQLLDDALKSQVSNNEGIMKQIEDLMLLMSIIHGTKLGNNIMTIIWKLTDKRTITFDCIMARTMLSMENWKEKLNAFSLIDLLRRSLKVHDSIRDKSNYFMKVHGMFICKLLQCCDSDKELDNGISLTVVALYQLYLDFIGMNDVYEKEKQNMNNEMDDITKMSDDDDSYDDNNDEESDEYDYISQLGENYLEVSEALQNQELELLAYDKLFYTSYMDYLKQFFTMFKSNCNAQRTFFLQQNAGYYLKTFNEILSN